MIGTLLDKINVLMIVREHFASLKDEGASRYKPQDILLFYAVPAAAVAALAYFRVSLSQQTIGVLITALSVIAGLLFNLLVLLHSLDWTETREPLASRLARFLGQLHSNIAYAIVVALVAMIPLVVSANYQDGHPYAMRVVAGYATWYLVIHFTLTMWMVLNACTLHLSSGFLGVIDDEART